MPGRSLSQCVVDLPRLHARGRELCTSLRNINHALRQGLLLSAASAGRLFRIRAACVASTSGNRKPLLSLVGVLDGLSLSRRPCYRSV